MFFLNIIWLIKYFYIIFKKIKIKKINKFVIRKNVKKTNSNLSDIIDQICKV